MIFQQKIQRMQNKYNIVENSSKSKLPVNKNLENKKVIIKPEKAIKMKSKKEIKQMKNKKQCLKIVIFVKKDWFQKIFINFMEICVKNVENIIIHLGQ